MSGGVPFVLVTPGEAAAFDDGSERTPMDGGSGYETTGPLWWLWRRGVDAMARHPKFRAHVSTMCMPDMAGPELFLTRYGVTCGQAALAILATTAAKQRTPPTAAMLAQGPDDPSKKTQEVVKICRTAPDRGRGVRTLYRWTAARAESLEARKEAESRHQSRQTSSSAASSSPQGQIPMEDG
jgi:hypothetical protein